MTIEEDINTLIRNLPFFIQENLSNHSNRNNIVEIVMDLGRRPEVRFYTRSEYLSPKIISWQDIDYTTKRISKFNNNNRAGIERTLHRISCIRNRQSLINGLTCRIGRTIFGTISIIRDLLESDKSILILGKPGVGKTTMIREIARVLSDEIEKRVIIIDTSNEIAGDSDIPHSGIGRARRMQVSKTELQYHVMIEAVENHMPEVIVIDEIGTELEVLAARTIAEKGVQLVATTHGNSVENLIKNPSFSDLIGGIKYVTLSDEEAKRRGTQKSILERRAYPAFQIVIEINDSNSWIIHENIKESIDLLLRKTDSIIQIRQFGPIKKTNIHYSKLKINPLLLFQSSKYLSNIMIFNSNDWTSFSSNKDNLLIGQNSKIKPIFIYTYSLSYNLIKESIAKIKINVIFTKEIRKANIIIGLKKHLKQNLKLKKLALQNNIPIYTINRQTVYHLMKVIKLVVPIFPKK